jgi:ADP-ribose pyrophosphatase YjhB (NUDIX family)
MESIMNFCSSCGASVKLTIPAGDNRPRFVCSQCQTVHYENPRIVVGCVPEYQGKILICKRAIEPRLGFWTVPAGFLENGETLEAGAQRECYEEALADVTIGSLLSVINVTYAHQVHVLFRATLNKPVFGAGSESLEVKLVSEAEIPWADIAFRSIDFGLKRYFDDRVNQHERVHMESLFPQPTSG